MKKKSYLSYYNIYGDLKNDNKPLILVALVDNNHYQLIDYNNNLLSFDYGVLVDSKATIKNKENIDSEYYFNLNKYCKNTLLLKTKNDYPYYPGYNNGNNFYKDISEYIKSTINNFKNDNINS